MKRIGGKTRTRCHKIAFAFDVFRTILLYRYRLTFCLPNIDKDKAMGGIKTEYSIELNLDHMAWLKEMCEKYTLDDEGKALRIVLDYIKEEADLESVFEEIRCNHCD